MSWEAGGAGGGSVGGLALAHTAQPGDAAKPLLTGTGGNQTSGGVGSPAGCNGVLFYGGRAKVICPYCGGGGGGYYGGACYNLASGAGGSSYSSGTILANSRGVNNGNGYVTIVPYIASPSSQPTRSPTSQPTRQVCFSLFSHSSYLTLFC